MESFNKYTLILCCLLLSACSGTRYLSEGEKLYTGAENKIESVEKQKTRLIKSIAEDAVRPEPNKVFFGFRPKLWLYNVAGENPKSKFKQWLKKKGEAPVLISDVKPGITSEIIDARLFNMGIFKSSTESKIIEKKHTFKVVYTSHIHRPYIVKDLTYDIADDSISHLVLAEKDKSLIKPGKDYNLDVLRGERMRIDAILKNKGYFYFKPDYLLFKADTSKKDQKVSFKLMLKDSIPENALKVYRINNVFVNQNFSLKEKFSRDLKDTLMFDNIVFFGKKEGMEIKPKVLSNSIYLRKKDVFSRQNHMATLNHLMSMGNFKLVQVNFSKKKDLAPGLLDVNILMTPIPKYTFRTEVDLVSKSNNYTGPRVDLSILDRNTFRGAELLALNMSGSFEAQLDGGGENLYSYSWNPQLELTFPRFLVPFKIKRTNSIYIPKTSLLLSYNYMKRVNYFDMRTFRFAYSFKWKEDIRKEHELNPIDISYTSLGNKSTEFTDLLESNPFLKKSYEEKFIAGASYSFTYNEQMLTGKKLQYYVHINPELAGNTLSLISMISGKKVSSDNPSTIVGSVYSQFAKISLDGRVYYNFRDKNKLAMRLFAGVAKPYGNSSVLPYSKQFFSGGPNSIRAFHINSVGPGTIYQDAENVGFLQLGGDVKLEMNTEYRFNIYRYFKGAFFVDAGNVWSLKSNSSDFTSSFMISKFMDEMAVGAGMGLRIDVSFFVLRLDLATPLRKPWLEENHRWVTNKIDFCSSSWRKDNLVLNVAIGYPF